MSELFDFVTADIESIAGLLEWGNNNPAFDWRNEADLHVDEFEQEQEQVRIHMENGYYLTDEGHEANEGWFAPEPQLNNLRAA